MTYDESGWLFPSPDYKPNNDVHFLTEENLMDMYQESLNDNVWAASVRNEVIYKDKNPGSARDFLIDELRIMNTGGTVIQFPYGHVITFPSKRHFFRGEKQIYQESVPSLNRKIDKMSPYNQELYRSVANMRIEQFAKFIWQFNIVPYWEAKLSDVNFMALAQHYGFETHLLDLTNDFMTALFFATCYYDNHKGKFFPLTAEMINYSEDTQYGVIFHAPNWVIDYLQPGGSMQWLTEHMNDRRQEPYALDSGELDGMAFQIGYQPLHRCHFQNGYIFPMRNSAPLQQDIRFEKLRFKQSVELAQKVYDFMDGGKKVYPQEGISAANAVLEKIQRSTHFSENDLESAYYVCDKTMFQTKESLKDALLKYDLGGGKINIGEEEIEYPITKELQDEINSYYDGVDLFQAIGGMLHQLPEHKRYRQQRCIEIYGKEI